MKSAADKEDEDFVAFKRWQAEQAAANRPVEENDDTGADAETEALAMARNDLALVDDILVTMKKHAHESASTQALINQMSEAQRRGRNLIHSFKPLYYRFINCGFTYCICKRNSG